MTRPPRVPDAANNSGPWVTAVQKHGQMVTGRKIGNDREFLSLTRLEVTKDQVGLSRKPASIQGSTPGK